MRCDQIVQKEKIGVEGCFIKVKEGVGNGSWNAKPMLVVSNDAKL
jgi:hypothetical protein